MDTCPVALLNLFIQHRDKHDSEVSHCSQRWGQCASAVCVCYLAGIVMSQVICLPPDDGGPSVPGSSPGWQEAGAAGSGTRHFLPFPNCITSKVRPLY